MPSIWGPNHFKNLRNSDLLVRFGQRKKKKQLRWRCRSRSISDASDWLNAFGGGPFFSATLHDARKPSASFFFCSTTGFYSNEIETASAPMRFLNSQRVSARRARGSIIRRIIVVRASECVRTDMQMSFVNSLIGFTTPNAARSMLPQPFLLALMNALPDTERARCIDIFFFRDGSEPDGKLGNEQECGRETDHSATAGAGSVGRRRWLLRHKRIAFF